MAPLHLVGPLTLEGMVVKLQLFEYANVVRSPTEEIFGLLVVQPDGLVGYCRDEICSRNIGVFNGALEASNLGGGKGDLLEGGGGIRDDVEDFALQ